jgi:hypothetical protein
MSFKVIALFLLTIALGFVAGLVPSDIVGGESYIDGLIPAKGACLGLIIGLLVFILGRLLSVGFYGIGLRALLLASGIAFLGCYFGNFVRDGSETLQITTTQFLRLEASPRGMAAFIDYMGDNLKEIDLQDDITKKQSGSFGPVMTKILFLVDLFLCVCFFFLVVFFFFVNFSYCRTCLRYKKKSGSTVLYFPQDNSDTFSVFLGNVGGLIQGGDYSKTIAYLLEAKRGQDRVFTPDFLKSKELKKTAHFKVSLTETRCPVCQESTLKGDVQSQDSAGNLSAMTQCNFSFISRPHENPMALSALAV